LHSIWGYEKCRGNGVQAFKVLRVKTTIMHRKCLMAILIHILGGGLGKGFESDIQALEMVG
jgi:hypothetical protein